MRCPHCGANNDRVIDSRSADGALSIRRRRECILCGTRFTSYERIERRLPKIVKRDGHREDFDRAKLERGIHSACRKRPIPSTRIAEMVDALLDDIERINKAEVSSQWVGQAVMARLAELDPVAYVRFASVYSAFDDVSQFIEVVRNMQPSRRLPRPRASRRAAGAETKR